MSVIPEKCSRCGAPISWEEGASIVKCEFCGYKNNLKPNFLNFKVNKEIQDKINKIYLPAKTVLKNKYVKFILLSSLVSIFGLSLNKAINDPVNPYKWKIKEYCGKASSIEKIDFIARKISKDCTNFFVRTITSLDKIVKEERSTFEYSKSLKNLRNKLSSKSFTYKIDCSFSECRLDYHPKKGVFIRSGFADFRYLIPLKSQLRFIKNDCRNIEELTKIQKKLIELRNTNSEFAKKIDIIEITGLLDEDIKGTDTEEWKNWRMRYDLLNNILSIKLNETPYLREIKPYDLRYSLSEKDCIKKISAKFRKKN